MTGCTVRKIFASKVCVVGGAGFLGTHLVNHLIDDRECEVLVVDNLVVGRREWVHPQASFEHHDITGSEEYLCKLLREYEIEYLFNYAAYPYVPTSFERPLHVFNVNAMGALKVINAAAEAGCKGILQVSSAELYGGGSGREPDSTERGRGLLWAEGCRINESWPVVPHSTYGAAKAAVDALVQVRFKEASTPVLALRQFNCIGERETHPYVVPEIISQLVRQTIGSKFREVTGDEFPDKVVAVKPDDWKYRGTVRLGNNSARDFLYAGDAMRMAVELLEGGEFGEVYNLGSEQVVKVYDLARMVGEAMGFKEVLVEHETSRDRPWEIWHLQSDNSRINSVVKYRPQVLLREALAKAVAWFYGNGAKWPWQQ
jgi:nucleoside-diphosphate-sugar epimerase